MTTRYSTCLRITTARLGELCIIFNMPHTRTPHATTLPVQKHTYIYICTQLTYTTPPISHSCPQPTHKNTHTHMVHTHTYTHPPVRRYATSHMSDRGVFAIEENGFPVMVAYRHLQVLHMHSPSLILPHSTLPHVHTSTLPHSHVHTPTLAHSHTSTLPHSHSHTSTLPPLPHSQKHIFSRHTHAARSCALTICFRKPWRSMGSHSLSPTWIS